MKNRNKNHNNLLSGEQSKKATQLRKKAGKAALALVETQDFKQQYKKVGRPGYYARNKNPSALTLLSLDIEEGIKKGASYKAHRAAKKHYRKHEAAYQNQALAEATADGVYIHGWNAVAPELDAKPEFGKLRYDLAGEKGSLTVEIDLRGSLEEAQDSALFMILDAEMSPTLDVVRNAQITLADGTEQSWHQFTAPAIERQMSQGRESR